MHQRFKPNITVPYPCKNTVSRTNLDQLSNEQVAFCDQECDFGDTGFESALHAHTNTHCRTYTHTRFVS